LKASYFKFGLFSHHSNFQLFEEMSREMVDEESEKKAEDMPSFSSGGVVQDDEEAPRTDMSELQALLYTLYD
jgi:hypothetical protein